MKYRYRLWCPDCFREDFQGCFDGGYEDDEELFDTREEAEVAGYEATSDNVWEFEVIEVREENQGK